LLKKREEVTAMISMHRKVHHIGIVDETSLSSIAMMNIPIDNQDFVHTKLLSCVCRSHSYIVYDTVATSFTRFSVMTWWANDCKSIV
jgi:hypothetical protein